MERTEAVEKLQELMGKELHELAREYGVTIYRNGKVNKGWAGHVCERYLELPINSAQSPNFGSWELKSIPLKTLKNGNLVFKETMAITMIDPVNVCQKEFEESPGSMRKCNTWKCWPLAGTLGGYGKSIQSS